MAFDETLVGCHRWLAQQWGITSGLIMLLRSLRRGGPDTTLSVWIVEQQEAQDKALSF